MNPTNTPESAANAANRADDKSENKGHIGLWHVHVRASLYLSKTVLLIQAMKQEYRVRVNLNMPAQQALNGGGKSSLSPDASFHLSFHPNEDHTNIMPHMYSKLKNVASVSIPSHIESIDSHAFADCPKLTKVFFEGSKLPKVHPLAFTGCPLKSNTIRKQRPRLAGQAATLKDKTN